ncbi:hypothetical protein RHSIM_Rhsim02G0242600 [Rhododendron simsii]|uniref:Homeobox-leucine zipper protein n=1 Tax=Rhododendron simsii TaxID=118357 RepID=A0A834LSC9_RHOSS|nr:hypothetical protein RHSIM_Rhsim02G0242600 [Rhododendron simsii]
MEQVRTLKKNFEQGNKLEPESKIHLARVLRLQPRQIAIWFQNRRARWKTKQLEKDYQVLKRLESVKADNDALQSQKSKPETSSRIMRGGATAPCSTSSPSILSRPPPFTTKPVKPNPARSFFSRLHPFPFASPFRYALSPPYFRRRHRLLPTTAASSLPPPGLVWARSGRMMKLGGSAPSGE